MDAWSRLRTLFDDALALPAAERAAFVAAAAGGDVGLCREAMALLAAHDDDPTFLEEPVRADALALLAEAQQRVGSRIGPYRLLRLLGHGGMGSVFLAERADGQFARRVALKLVYPGGPRSLLAQRFLQERQILASLQHPHIARLYGGGVAGDGRPFFAMEYVEGEPLTAYCDRRRLGTHARLRLFLQVAEAVHYAHQNLVVHRDLKPSNILVTEGGGPDGGPTVKLLDFGIAKLLAPDAASADTATRTGLPAMTPAYAAPEQVRGDALTTATDVYALGVLLFELLTGGRPYEVPSGPPAAVERAICEAAPLRPSLAARRDPAAAQARGTSPERLARRLRGDLDTIVLKALRKEPARRYASVQQLADDVARHLARLPITARPDTLAYRASRFVRRHTAGAAATLLVALALVGGLVVSLHQARVADRRFVQTRALANALLFDLHDAIRDLPGATPARELLVAQALRYLHTLRGEAGADAALQAELAEAYTRVGEVQGDPHFPNLGNLTGAAESYAEALRLREALWQARPDDPARRHALAKALGRLAVVRSWGGDNDEAIRLSRRALDLLASLPPAADDLAHDRGRLESELGWWLIWAGRVAEAEALLAAAERRLAPLARRHPNDLDVQIDAWRVGAYQVDGLWFSGEHDAAGRLLDTRVLPAVRTLARRFPANPRVQTSLLAGLNKTGTMQSARGHPALALATYREALQTAQALATIDSTNTRARGAVASAHEAIGNVLVALGRLPEAVDALEAARAVKERLYDPTNGETGNALANTLRSLCEARVRLGDAARALPHCLRAVAVQEVAVASDPRNAVGRANLAAGYAATARAYRRQALDTRPPGPAALRRAAAYFDRALTLYDRLTAEGTEIDFGLSPETLRAERAALPPG